MTCPVPVEAYVAAGSNIVSFVLRFVCEEPFGESEDLTVARYGVVRHVQSDTERHLTSWDEIVAFIEQYVGLSKDAEDE